jgi:hypothetical protein
MREWGREGEREKGREGKNGRRRGGWRLRENTPMLIGDGTSVLLYVFLVCCALCVASTSVIIGPYGNTSPTTKAGNEAERERRETRLPNPLISRHMQIPLFLSLSLALSFPRYLNIACPTMQRNWIASEIPIG